MKTKTLFSLFVILIFVTLAVILVTRSEKPDELVEPEVSLEFSEAESGVELIDPADLQNSPKRLVGSLNEIIETELAHELGRDAGFIETYRRENDQWIILCGRPLELNGKPFDYLKSPMREKVLDNLMEDNACFLGERKSKNYVLREAEIGALDSPILSWLELYELPANILKD